MTIELWLHRSCKALGLTPIVVYTEPDALSLHVLEAEVKACLGSSPRDYTNPEKLLEAAKAHRCARVCNLETVPGE